MKRLIFTLAAVIAVLAVNAQLLRTTVEQGEIEGVPHAGHALYMNIPYAEPPVGPLRWKAPVPKAPWQGIYKADRWGDKPMQPSNPAQGTEGMSEDCLYLSVETPAKSADERLPVFVMIHGGAFIGGSYQGTQESFVKEGIVYVSVEYRLGVMGFLSHPELSKESDNGVSGNYGILDQIEALRWIHRNIAAFGGDPERVTIAGESAGGISVSILCASPLCKGLFQGAVSESGSSFWPVGESRNGNTAMCTSVSAEKVGLDFQKSLGKKDIKGLRSLPASEVIAGVRMEQFWPVVDGYAITDDQYKLYESGNYNDVNVLIGTNSDEGAMFSGPTPVADYQARIRGIYGAWADKVLAMYPATTEQEAWYALSDIFRDGSFAWGTYAWANLQSKNGKGDVYLYYFDQNSQNTAMPSPRGGATHVAEMPFFYGYKMGKGTMTPTEEHMHQIMERYMINFTKTGSPNAEALPYWTAYEQGQPTVMIMREGFYLAPVPNQPQLDLFEAFFAEKRATKSAIHVPTASVP